MKIAIPTEIKNQEYRVGMTPAAVREAVHHGHEVFVQSEAGIGCGFDNNAYEKAGAKILATADEIFETGEMIVKVKEPQPIECRRLTDKHLLFTYLHLAPDPQQTDLLLESGCTAIAYETVTDSKNRLPLLAPMSEVAGRMSAQVGAVALQKPNGGLGVLLGGVPGVAPAKVTVIGGGVVGTNAARMAMGLGADVTILDRSVDRLTYLDDVFGPRLKTVYSTQESVEEHVLSSDLVIGAVLIPGAAAPKLVSRAMLKDMKDGAVLVDVAIDQGGCFETSKATTHDDPTYVIDNVVHYCVANMPGAVARTSTLALNNATLPYTLALADKGWQQAVKEDAGLLEGVNIHAGTLTCAPVAEALGKTYTPLAL